jgi:phosphoribosylglycinamide formyltransferase 1
VKKIIIFASGAGSNAGKIIDHFKNSSIARVTLIICNKAGAGVLSIAKNEGIPALLIERERFFRGDAYLPILKKENPDLIVLAGFLWKIPDTIINSFPHRIINIHPALLPKYGGKGMYGDNVHTAVLANKEAETGITIHFVDGHYDNGDIIKQVKCPVKPDDTPDELAKRIHQLEYLHYPAEIEKLLIN